MDLLLQQNQEHSLNAPTLDTTKDNEKRESLHSTSPKKSFHQRQRVYMRSPQPNSGKKDLQESQRKPPTGGKHTHTRSIFQHYKNEVMGQTSNEGAPQRVNLAAPDILTQKRRSYIGMGSNHALSKKSIQASQGSSGGAGESNIELHNRNPIIFINPKNP